MVRLAGALAVLAVAASPALAWPFTTAGRALLAETTSGAAVPTGIPADAASSLVVLGDLPVKQGKPTMMTADQYIAASGKTEAQLAAEVKQYHGPPTSNCSALLADPLAEPIAGTDKVRIWGPWTPWENMTVRVGGGRGGTGGSGGQRALRLRERGREAADPMAGGGGGGACGEGEARRQRGKQNRPRGLAFRLPPALRYTCVPVWPHPSTEMGEDGPCARRELSRRGTRWAPRRADPPPTHTDAPAPPVGCVCGPRPACGARLSPPTALKFPRRGFCGGLLGFGPFAPGKNGACARRELRHKARRARSARLALCLN